MGISRFPVLAFQAHARKITETGKVHAVPGGSYLAGTIFNPVIPPPIAAMKGVRPDLIVPMHCTGWEAITRSASEMPEQCVMDTVGTMYGV